MTDTQVWFITGASRGMGVDFAKAALAARTEGPKPAGASLRLSGTVQLPRPRQRLIRSLNHHTEGRNL